MELYRRLLAEEYEKLLHASNRDVHESSKTTTLPIARRSLEIYVRNPKLPLYVDFLNINLNVSDSNVARARIARYASLFAADGTRVTENLDFA